MKRSESRGRSHSHQYPRSLRPRHACRLRRMCIRSRSLGPDGPNRSHQHCTVRPHSHQSPCTSARCLPTLWGRRRIGTRPKEEHHPRMCCPGNRVMTRRRPGSHIARCRHSQGPVRTPPCLRTSRPRSLSHWMRPGLMSLPWMTRLKLMNRRPRPKRHRCRPGLMNRTRLTRWKLRKTCPLNLSPLNLTPWLRKCRRWRPDRNCPKPCRCCSRRCRCCCCCPRRNRRCIPPTLPPDQTPKPPSPHAFHASATKGSPASRHRCDIRHTQKFFGPAPSSEHGMSVNPGASAKVSANSPHATSGACRLGRLPHPRRTHCRSPANRRSTVLRDCRGHHG